MVTCLQFLKSLKVFSILPLPQKMKGMKIKTAYSDDNGRTHWPFPSNLRGIHLLLKQNPFFSLFFLEGNFVSSAQFVFLFFAVSFKWKWDWDKNKTLDGRKQGISTKTKRWKQCLQLPLCSNSLPNSDNFVILCCYTWDNLKIFLSLFL